MGIEGFFIENNKQILFDTEIVNSAIKYYYKPSEFENGKYSLVLYLNKDSIEFRFSGDLKATENNISSSYYRPDDEIFTLNLKTDSFLNLDLDEELKLLFSGCFPILQNLELNKEIKNESFPKNYKNSFRVEDKNINSEDRKRLFFRELFLDFLFEVKYNPIVFEDNPNFKDIKSLLLGSKFIQSILIKSEFYFHFEGLKTPSYLNQTHNNLLISDLKLAMKNWFELLQEPHSDKIINEDTNWFNDVETEMVNALHFKNQAIKKVDKTIKKEINKKSDELEEYTTSWFIDRNNIFRAWMTGGLWSKILFAISLIAIVLSISAFIDQIYNCSILPFLQCDLSEFIIPFIAFMALINILASIIFKTKILNSELLLLTVWILVGGALHFVFEKSSFYNRNFIKSSWSEDLGWFFIGTLGGIILYKVLWYSWLKDCNWKKIYHKLQSKKRKKYVIFWSLTVIVLLAICYYYSEYTIYVFIILFTFLISILFIHERDTHPNLSPTTSFNKTLSMLFYGLVISFFINVFYINTEYKEYLERYEYLGHIWHHTQKEYAFSDKDKDGYFSFSEVKENYTGEYDVEINDAPKQHIKLHSTSKPVKDKDYYSYFYVYEPKDSSYQNDRSKFIVSKENLKKRLKIKKNELVSLSEKLKKVRVQLDNSKNGLDSIQQHNFNQLSDDSLNVVDKIKKDSIQLNKKIKYFNKKFFLKYIKVKKSIYQPLSDDIEVTIDKYFFKELQNVYLYKGMDYDSVNKKWYYKRSKVPVIKEINLFGIKIITIPNILFINTFLSLFIAVILQIFIHKTKFLKGGSGHGH